jgi:hypothetical protein
MQFRLVLTSGRTGWTISDPEVRSLRGEMAVRRKCAAWSNVFEKEGGSPEVKYGRISARVPEPILSEPVKTLLLWIIDMIKILFSSPSLLFSPLFHSDHALRITRRWRAPRSLALRHAGLLAEILQYSASSEVLT